MFPPVAWGSGFTAVHGAPQQHQLDEHRNKYKGNSLLGKAGLSLLAIRVLASAIRAPLLPVR